MKICPLALGRPLQIIFLNLFYQNGSIDLISKTEGPISNNKEKRNVAPPPPLRNAPGIFF